MSLNEQITPPDLNNVFESSKKEVFATFNAINIGEIKRYDGETQSAEIELVIKRQVSENEIRTLPLLVDVPVFVLQGGGAYIDMPIESGDIAIVLFNDRDIDTWWATGNKTEPRTKRKHALSDALAIVGINRKDRAKDHDSNLIRLIPKNGDGDLAASAREGDQITIDSTTDPEFIAWMGGVASATGVTPAPDSVTGVISSGSEGVEVG